MVIGIYSRFDTDNNIKHIYSLCHQNKIGLTDHMQPYILKNSVKRIDYILDTL